MTEIRTTTVLGCSHCLQHCRFAASSEKLTSKWFGCVPDLLSILGKHRFIMNRQCYNQVGFYLKLLCYSASC